ncbi:hypothetical protein B0H15DRAFT_145377 [Mycena belliarum]|uniref:Uncharacterized protein n=1 Tax=Mycena belliarum TaxID=1033014 RepID=A0AAD6U963_9AGAR|nr:hypothetical protein B0H15DRAFT_145377 [Mycena belliae]
MCAIDDRVAHSYLLESPPSSRSREPSLTGSRRPIRLRLPSPLLPHLDAPSSASSASCPAARLGRKSIASTRRIPACVPGTQRRGQRRRMLVHCAPRALSLSPPHSQRPRSGRRPGPRRLRPRRTEHAWPSRRTRARYVRAPSTRALAAAAADPAPAHVCPRVEVTLYAPRPTRSHRRSAQVRLVLSTSLQKLTAHLAPPSSSRARALAPACRRPRPPQHTQRRRRPRS